MTKKDTEWAQGLEFDPKPEDDELVATLAYEIYQAMWENLETMVIAESLAQLQKANGSDPKKEMTKLFANARKEFMSNFDWKNYKVRGDSFLKAANERIDGWQDALVDKIGDAGTGGES